MMTNELETAINLHRQGKFSEAKSLYLKIREQQPDLSDPWHLLGVMAHQFGRNEEAEPLILNAIQRDGDLARPYYNLAIVRQALGKLDLALAAAEEAIKRDAGDPEFYNLLVTIQLDRHDYEKAEQSLKQGLSLAPNDFDLNVNAGAVYKELKQLDKAERHILSVLDRDPDNASALCTLGAVNHLQGKLDKAAACLEKAIRLDPTVINAAINLAVVYKEMARFDEAIALNKKLLETAQDKAEIHWNLSHLLLMQGDMEEGLKEYEWRFIKKEKGVVNRPSISDRPYWDGEIKNGLRLITFYEQGLGDIFQFMRYGEVLQKQGLSVYLLAPKSLKKFLQGSPGFAGIIGKGEPLPDHDVQVPLLSLPYLTGTRMETIPAKVPYIQARPEDVLKWRDRLKDLPRPLIGICWQGNPNQQNDINRSMPLHYIKPLLDAGIGTFVNLHKGAGEADIEKNNLTTFIKNYADEVDPGPDNFLDTAGLIENMDLVITVCTSIAHLSGSMGKKTWVMLTHVPDWRWYRDRDDSPWYPTARLFRQDKTGNWPGLVLDIKQALQMEYGQ